MELLNLDELVAPQREVRLGGKNYQVAEQSVGQMLEAIRLEKAYENQDNPEELLLAMQGVIAEMLPDLPEKEIRKLSFRQMTAIIEFCNATDQEVIEGSEASDAEKK